MAVFTSELVETLQHFTLTNFSTSWVAVQSRRVRAATKGVSLIPNDALLKGRLCEPVLHMLRVTSVHIDNVQRSVHPKPPQMSVQILQGIHTQTYTHDTCTETDAPVYIYIQRVLVSSYTLHIFLFHLKNRHGNNIVMT